VKKLFLALALLMMPTLAAAANEVSLTSEMFVERTVVQPGGKTKIVLSQPKSVPPGAKLVFVLSYRNVGKTPATNFTVTNPMPAGVIFDGAVTPGSDVSVNNGQNWGQLATLRVPVSGAAPRAARTEDVTTVRWILKAPIPVAGTGKLSFKGIVK
jgi:uncharacterized repeat protein (TIGR01451 family)